MQSLRLLEGVIYNGVYWYSWFFGGPRVGESNLALSYILCFISRFDFRCKIWARAHMSRHAGVLHDMRHRTALSILNCCWLYQLEVNNYSFQTFYPSTAVICCLSYYIRAGDIGTCIWQHDLYNQWSDWAVLRQQCSYIWHISTAINSLNHHSLNEHTSVTTQLQICQSLDCSRISQELIGLGRICVRLKAFSCNR